MSRVQLPGGVLKGKQMILWGVFERVDSEFAKSMNVKRAVFIDKNAAVWFLNNYPPVQKSPGEWFVDCYGSVNW